MNASGALSQDTWEEVLQADVDEVYATSSIAQALLEEIWVMPWVIRGPEHAQTAFDEGENSDRWSEIAVAQDGVPILPSIENLGKIENQNLFPLETRGKKLLLFEFSQDCPAILRRFLHRNFGTYYQWIEPSAKVRRIKWFEGLVPNTVTETVPISDLASLCGALDSFSGELGRMPPKRFIAPCELNALGLRGMGFFGHRFQHLYRVVVGSTPEDFAFYWNS